MVRTPAKTRAKVTLFALLSVFFIFTSGCGKFSSIQRPYVYQDPSSGNKTELRPSDYTLADKSKVDFELLNPQIQLLRNSQEVYFWVKLKTTNENTQIELRGKLDEKNQAWITDTQTSKNNKPRMKGFVRCLGGESINNCHELYVSVYFYRNGKLIERQFTADASASINTLTQKKSNRASNEGLKSTEPQKTKKQEIDLNPDGKDAISNETDDTTSENNNGSEDETPTTTEPSTEPDEQEEDDIAPTGNGHYMAPIPSTEFLSELSGASPKVETTPNVDLVTTMGFNYELEAGGKAIRRPYYAYDAKLHRSVFGSISAAGTELPKSGDGYKRVSVDSKAYGTGYLVNFLTETSKRFYAMNPSCGPIVINNLSKKKGGLLQFLCFKSKSGHCSHKSHQNGLDADIAYLPFNSQWNVLLNRRTLKKSFNMKCNYDYFKYLTSFRLPEVNEQTVFTILVHSTIKRKMCEWAKKNKYTTAEDQRVFNTLYSNDNHNNHLHVRLYCSPKHNDCWQDGREALDDNHPCDLSKPYVAPVPKKKNPVVKKSPEAKKDPALQSQTNTKKGPEILKAVTDENTPEDSYADVPRNPIPEYP